MRATAQQVAQAGVPLADLAPQAPERHVVQRGDTLWGISALFLTRPWRWPELWGMNLEQISNPHLIYPGQVLVLEKKDGRATLRIAADEAAGASVRLSPRVRSQLLDNGAIAAVPLNAIGAFLNEAVVFDDQQLLRAPRIVATQEGRVMVSRGETAYVRGERNGARDFRLFREPTPLLDPLSLEVLGYEGRYVGTAEFVRDGSAQAALTAPAAAATDAGAGPGPGSGAGPVVPDTYRISSTRLESKIGDRLSPVTQQELVAYTPHAPRDAIDGRIVSVYGDGLQAGQNQVVAINRGLRDGIERGHVLALWRAGAAATDTTGTPQADGSSRGRQAMKLPDERHGLLFVFRTFERVSYALILNVQQPVRAGDRFSQP